MGLLNYLYYLLLSCHIYTRYSNKVSMAIVLFIEYCSPEWSAFPLPFATAETEPKRGGHGHLACRHVGMLPVLLHEYGTEVMKKSGGTLDLKIPLCSPTRNSLPLVTLRIFSTFCTRILPTIRKAPSSGKCSIS